MGFTVMWCLANEAILLIEAYAPDTVVMQGIPIEVAAERICISSARGSRPEGVLMTS